MVGCSLHAGHAQEGEWVLHLAHQPQEGEHQQGGSHHRAGPRWRLPKQPPLSHHEQPPGWPAAHFRHQGRRAGDQGGRQGAVHAGQ